MKNLFQNLLKLKKLLLKRLEVKKIWVWIWIWIWEVKKLLLKNLILVQWKKNLLLSLSLLQNLLVERKLLQLYNIKRHR
jgi:hypothetical protein